MKSDTASLINSLLSDHPEDQAALDKELGKLTSLSSTNGKLRNGGLVETLKGANTLGSALARNTSITKVVIEDGSLGDPVHIEFLIKIQKNKTITELELSSWIMDDANTRALAFMLAHGNLKKLTIRPMRSSGLSSTIVEAISKNTTLTSLTLKIPEGNVVNAAEDIIQILSKNSTLKFLDINISGPQTLPSSTVNQLAQTIEKSGLTYFYWSRIDDMGYDDWNENIQEKLSEKRSKSTQAEEPKVKTSDKDKEPVKMSSKEIKALLNDMGTNPSEQQKTSLKEALKQLDEFSSYKPLDPSALSHLLEALKTNETITSLALQEQKIAKDEFKLLANALRHNKKIKYLHLGENQIGLDSFNDVIELLKANKNLALVSLRDNPLVNQSASIIALLQKNINLIRPDEFSTIVSSFEETTQKLLSRQIEENYALFSAGEITASMDKDEKVKRLLTLLKNIIKNPSDKQKTALKTALSHFDTLPLAYELINDSHIDYLAEALIDNVSVTNLELRINKITQKGAEVLSTLLEKNKTITHCNLKGSKLNEETLSRLETLLENNRKALKASSEKIDSYEQVEKIKKLLASMGTSPSEQQKASLKEALNSLDNLYVKLETSEMPHLFEALKTNEKITTLSIRNTNIAKNEFKWLVDALRHNKKIDTLYLGENQIGLESFNDVIELLKTNKNLTYVSLKYTPLASQSAGIIALLQKNINLITPAEFNKISYSFEETTRELLSRQIKENYALFSAGEITASMDKDKKVKRLLVLLENIAKNPSDKQKTALKTALSHFDMLSLFCKLIDDSQIEYLAEALMDNESVTSLELAYSEITQKGAEILFKLLEKNKTITQCDLKNNNLNEETLSRLETLLENNKKPLEASGSYEQREKIKALLSDMGTNPSEQQKASLKEALNQANYFDIKLNTSEMPHLFEALKTNESITSLVLTNTNIAKNEFKWLVDALRHNKKIVYLHIGDNQIGLESFRDIVELLKTNKNLKIINLKGNPLVSQANGIVDLLQKNTNLITSDEFNNIALSFEEATQKLLSRQIEENHALFTVGEITSSMEESEKVTRLLTLLENIVENPSDKQKAALKTALSHFDKLPLSCKLTDDSQIEYLAEALMDNTSVTTLEFDDNDITEKEADALFKLLTKNKTITHCDLKDNNLDEKTLSRLEIFLENNRVEKSAKPETLADASPPIPAKTVSNSKKKILQGSSIATLIIGAIAAPACLFLLAAPTLALAALGVCSITALVCFGLSTRIKQKQEEKTLDITKASNDAPPKTINISKKTEKVEPILIPKESVSIVSKLGIKMRGNR